MHLSNIGCLKRAARSCEVVAMWHHFVNECLQSLLAAQVLHDSLDHEDEVISRTTNCHMVFMCPLPQLQTHLTDEALDPQLQCTVKSGCIIAGLGFEVNHSQRSKTRNLVPLAGGAENLTILR